MVTWDFIAENLQHFLLLCENMLDSNFVFEIHAFQFKINN